ncbi:MAG: HIT family protein [Clostridia bacterium]|nr:HIT family protein [Clostridia bacterium]
MDCIFCRIVRGEVPSMKVYEDENVLVFMDIAADVDGHMVAIPKRHVESIIDCDETTLARLMTAVRRVARHCTENCGYEGVNLLNASGVSAGQSVPHFHIHIIPRKTGDGTDAWPILPGAKADIQATYEKLKMEAFI